MWEGVAFIRGQLFRTFAGPASARRFDGRNRIQELLEDFAVVDVRRSKDNGKWEAGRVGQQVTLGARLATIGRIRLDVLTLFGRNGRRIDASLRPVDGAAPAEPVK
jgi:hypothetical protein